MVRADTSLQAFETKYNLKVACSLRANGFKLFSNTKEYQVYTKEKTLVYIKNGIARKEIYTKAARFNKRLKDLTI